ncbi:serine/threonine-protein kinase [Flindersiella endophytica]
MHALQPDDPRQIGAYALLGRLGRGAMGIVYLAKSPGGRPVAVKVSRSELADDTEFRERFRREVEMARSVGGFWTAQVIDADPLAARPWLATEYVPGPSLQHAVSTHGPLPEAAVRRLAAGLAEALAMIHKAGLVHRDLKPSNVLLGSDGPRVIDFGISRALEGAKLTATGAFFGTPGFLSPEQITGEPIGPASDVFALGAVLVFAATGEGPFGDGDTSALVYRAVHTEPKLTRLTDRMRPIVSACLQTDPALRPAPGQLLDWIGNVGVNTPAAGSDQWLPAAVQTLVKQYHNELDESVSATAVIAQPPDVRARARAQARAQAEAQRPTPHAGQWPPPNGPAAGPSPQGTRRQPAPGWNGQSSPVAAATGPGSAQQQGSLSRSAEFHTSRATALAWSALTGFAGLFFATVANENSGQAPAIRLLALLAFIFFVVVTIRMLVTAFRSQYSVEVNQIGLNVTKDGQHWQLPWHTIARVRIVNTDSKPWLVVWFNDLYQGPHLNAFESRHGGVRVFPVGHEHLRRRRWTEVRELRAALAWHAPQALDRSP